MTPHMKLDDPALCLAWLSSYINELKETPNRFRAEIEWLQQINAMLSAAHAPQGGVRGEQPKYHDVLVPFLAMMEGELHANSGKGDRPGWLAMSREMLLLEIFYHLAKLQKATLNDDGAGIREFGADVANMAMMLVDRCGVLLPPPALTGSDPQ